jgi:hypothetical protein
VLAGTVVLDVGCGTAEHALLAYSVDSRLLASTPLLGPLNWRRPRLTSAVLGLASRCGIPWTFLVSASRSTRGSTAACSTFPIDEQRNFYVASVRATIPTDRRYFMLCFSDRQPGGWGPRRVTQDEIRTSFSERWRVDSIEPAVFEITIDSQ